MSWYNLVTRTRKYKKQMLNQSKFGATQLAIYFDTVFVSFSFTAISLQRTMTSLWTSSQNKATTILYGSIPTHTSILTPSELQEIYIAKFTTST